MPNRYEREIEEILRNLGETDTKAVKSQRFGEKFRRRPGPNLRTQPPRPVSWNLSTPERFLLGAVVCALIGGAYAYVAGPNIITLLLAIASLVSLVLVALSQFNVVPGQARSVRHGNVTITPLRRGPWNSMKTQWNLLLLKLRYRRKGK